MSEQLILICGMPASGKSLSLARLAHPERAAVLNCENKKLPFKPNGMLQLNVTDNSQVPQAIQEINGMANIDVIVIDTLDFLMTMYETNIIKKAANGQAAWGNYFTYFQELMQVHVAQSPKTFIFLAHAHTTVDDDSMTKVTSVPVKGALRNIGVESYFTTIVMAKQVPLRLVDPYKNGLLNVSEEDRERGVKYVFQTRVTKESQGEKLRAPEGMWDKSETYIDNNAQHVLTRLNTYYGSET